jgi:DNA-binding HxlR family transcriptional regulator
MPTPPRRPVRPASALDAALVRVGDRWSLLLVEALLPGPRRFNELLETLDGLAPNILSNRLKALEADGILAARPYSRKPYRVAYVLTARGAELAGALRLLAAWGAATGPRRRGVTAPHHATCGTNVEARWWCPTCDRVVDEHEAPDLEWV